MRDGNPVSQDERQDGYDDAVEEELGEEAYADGSNYEESVAAPF